MENAQVSNQQTFDAIVVGGGPSGATVATGRLRPQTLHDDPAM